MLGFPVYGGFDEAAHGTIGDGVCEGVEEVAAPAEIGTEELGVVGGAGKAAV